VAGRDAAEFVGVGEEAAVESRPLLELLVGAEVGEAAAVEDGDAVGEVEGGAAVGDQEGGPALHDVLQRLVDLVLHAGVHRRGRVVEDEQPRVGEERAGERDALALAAGEGQAVLADLGGVAVGQLGDEAIRLSGAGGGRDLLVGGVGAAVRDVGADRVREEERVLGDQADRGPQGVEGELADVVPADQDGAAGDVVEAGQQQGDRGLAGARGTDDGEGLAGADLEGEPLEHGAVVVVPEGDVVELDGRGGVGRELLGAVLQGRLGVDQFQDAFGARARLLADREDHGEHAHRADELREVGGEGDEGAERDVPADGEPAAEREHRDLPEGGDGLEGRGVPGVQPDRAQTAREEPPPDLPQLAGLLLLLPEALHHADTADGTVHHARDGGGLGLRVPGGGVQLRTAVLGDPPQGGGHGERDQGERRGQPRHDHQGDQEEQDVPDGHREHEEQALDELEVAGGAADDLAGGQLVLAAAVQPGDRPEHLGPQVVLDVEGETAAVVAADVGEDVDDQGRADQGARPGGHGAVVTADHVVDDHLGDQRDHRHHGHAGQRGAESEDDVPGMAPGVAGQSARPALFRPCPALLPLLRCHAVPSVRPDLPEGTNAHRSGFHPSATKRGQAGGRGRSGVTG
jgi:hypothetical protein